MYTVKIGKKTVEVAKSWNDLSLEQFKVAANCMFRFFTQLENGYNTEEIKSQVQPELVKTLLGLSTITFAKIEAVQMYDLVEITNFLFDKLNLYKTILTEFEYKGKTYYGPGDYFETTSFDEYIVADNYFVNFRTNNDVRYLDRLVASLYRIESENYDPVSPDFNGDRREKFNKNTVPVRANELAQLPVNIKQMVLLQYWGCRNSLERDYFKIFPQEKNGESSKPIRARWNGWNPVALSLSGDKFGDYQSTLNTPVKTVFAEYEENIKTKEKIKEIKERNKPKK